jgi:HlyD family secretion protein
MFARPDLRCAILTLTLALASCGDGAGSPTAGFNPADRALPAVEAVEVVIGSLPLEERLSGSVRAGNQTEIYARVAGTVEQVFVDDGDSVAAGEALVQLRSRDFEERVRQAEAGLQVAEARVRQAEANLQRVRAVLERVSLIVERQLGTQAELDSAVADALSAEADLDLMNAQRSQAASVLEERQAELADTLVRAPIDGVVGGRNAEVGQQANTGTPLFVIGDVSSLQVEITLTQTMLGYIEVGTPVAIYSDASPENVISSEITRISPYLHQVSRTTRAEIHLEPLEEGQILRPGMYVTVDVLYGQSAEAPVVPNSALIRHPRDGREGLFVTSVLDALADPEAPPQDPAKRPSVVLWQPVGPVPVRFVPVEVVARGRTTSGIRGVEPGDWVVTLGHNLLTGADEQVALVQPTPWEHILELQNMESLDLLEVIRAKEQGETSTALPD